MKDELEKGLKAGLRAGAVTFIGGAVSGDLQAAFAGASATMLGEGVLTAFEAMASGNTERMGLVAMREDIARLTVRVAKLERELEAEKLKPDRTDPISQAQTVSAFVRDVIAAPTVMKREALVNAAANQHDPRIGGAATRAFWYDELRKLSDIQVLIVQLVAEHGNLAFIHGEPLTIDGSHRDIELQLHPVDLYGEDAETVYLAMIDIGRAERYASRPIAPKSIAGWVRWKQEKLKPTDCYELTAGGKVLARLIAD